MDVENNLKHILNQWTGEFMHRSNRDFRQFMEQAGLSPSQVGILMGLFHGRLLGVTNIGEHLGVSSAAASQAIDQMVQLGLVERTEDPTDRRMKRLALTSQGKALVSKAVAARNHWLESIIESLTPEEQAQVSAAFSVMIDAMRRTQA